MKNPFVVPGVTPDPRTGPVTSLRRGLAWGALLALAVACPPASHAQEVRHAVAVGTQFQSYTFQEGLGAKVATLNLVPVAYALPLGDRFVLDLYGAYADGRVEKGGVTFILKGMVDTHVRASFQLAPWALLTGALTLPTGKSAHNDAEAVVASVLSTDILGFREASWGTGGAVASGIALAHRVGTWNLGLGASYRLSQGFEPTAGSSLTFEPGDEVRLRIGLDRNVGEGGKFALGFTVQQFAEDRFERATGEMRNLFQPGRRLRGDLSYSFRTGRSTWTLYVVDIWREQGDAFLDLVDNQGNVIGDTTVVVGSQNLAAAGLNGSVRLGSLVVRPSLDVRHQSRESGDGEGWLAGGGFDVPLRLWGWMDVFPRGRFSVGRLTGSDGKAHGLWGVELGFLIRRGLGG